MDRIGLRVPHSAIAHTLQEARPALRGVAGAAGRDPAGVHAGRPGRRVRRPPAAFEDMVARGLRESPIGQMLIEESVAGWVSSSSR